MRRASIDRCVTVVPRVVPRPRATPQVDSAARRRSAPRLRTTFGMTAQRSPLTRLRRALAGRDLLASWVTLRRAGLDEAAALLLLIAVRIPRGSRQRPCDSWAGRASNARSSRSTTFSSSFCCSPRLARGDDNRVRGSARRPADGLRLDRAARRAPGLPAGSESLEISNLESGKSGTAGLVDSASIKSTQCEPE